MDSLDHVWQERRPEHGTEMPVTENVAQPAIPARRRGHGRIQLFVLGLASLAAALVVAWLFLHRDGGSATGAVLERLAVSLDQPIYWAGPRAGYSYEVTVARSGRVYVRYLPLGVKAGDSRPSFLVVGTYMQPGSFADLQHAAKQTGAISVGTGHGGLLVYSSQHPSSAYLSFAGSKYQVEVYSPSGDTARNLVLAEKITPVPAR